MLKSNYVFLEFVPGDTFRFDAVLLRYDLFVNGPSMFHMLLINEPFMSNFLLVNGPFMDDSLLVNGPSIYNLLLVNVI